MKAVGEYDEEGSRKNVLGRKYSFFRDSQNGFLKLLPFVSVVNHRLI